MGLTKASTEDATSNAETVGIVGGVLVLAILLAAIAGGKAGTALPPQGGPRRYGRLTPALQAELAPDVPEARH